MAANYWSLALIKKCARSQIYVKVDQVVKCILSFPPGVHMAKIDIQHAYCNVPVHPDDRHLLAMQWQHEILVDKLLHAVRSQVCPSHLLGTS